MYSKGVDSMDKKDIRNHWNSDAVFTDVWNPDINGQELTEAELLPGELSASVYTVGCYIVRSAQRVYKVHEPGFWSERVAPASKEEAEFVRKYIGDRNMRDLAEYYNTFGWLPMRPPWEHDNLFTVHEISAKHHADTASQFTFICKAAHDRCVRPEASSFRGIRMWYQNIGCICTAKKHIGISNECVSLFVCNMSWGDYMFRRWYEFNPVGNITKF